MPKPRRFTTNEQALQVGITGQPGAYYASYKRRGESEAKRSGPRWRQEIHAEQAARAFAEGFEAAGGEVELGVYDWKD